MNFFSTLFQTSPSKESKEQEVDQPQKPISIKSIGGNGSTRRGKRTAEETQPTRHNTKRTKGRRGNDTRIQSRPKSAGNNHPLIFWDCSDIKRVPAVQKIKKFHIYDFDDTIFKSPSPNPSLYNDSTIGILTNSQMLHEGGWWAYPLMLKNAGEGWEVEKARRWESLWNEDIVELMKFSAEDEETLTIVMTGRRKNLFTHLIKEILESRDLNYDGLILKQGDFESTISFKTQVLTDILDYYHEIKEVVVYDDRKSQLNGFQTFLNEYNEAVRPELIYSLVPVFTPNRYLDPKTERELVEHYVNHHNTLVDMGDTSALLQKISFKKSFFYAAYVLNSHSKAEVIDFLIHKYPDYFNQGNLQVFKFQSDFIAISKSKLSRAAEKKLGSEKKKFEWRLTHFGAGESICAARVEPLDENVSTLHSPPVLPIASRGKSATTPIDEFHKINEWFPISEPISISTHFGQVISFKIVSDTVTDSKKKKLKG